jgi:hypothetical protein
MSTSDVEEEEEEEEERGKKKKRPLKLYAPLLLVLLVVHYSTHSQRVQPTEDANELISLLTVAHPRYSSGAVSPLQ